MYVNVGIPWISPVYIYIYVSMQGQVCHSCSDFGQVAAVAVLEGEVPVAPRHLVELNQESMAYVTRLERFAERSNFGLNDAKLNVIVPMKTATLGYIPFSDPNLKNMEQFDTVWSFGFDWFQGKEGRLKGILFEG
jgi:hypothetical protein